MAVELHDFAFLDTAPVSAMVGGMPIRRVTVYDIAEKLGVSHSTVSMALRNHPAISGKRRKQVIQAAAKMGYSPDPHLSALAAYRRAMVLLPPSYEEPTLLMDRIQLAVDGRRR